MIQKSVKPAEVSDDELIFYGMETYYFSYTKRLIYINKR